MSHEQDHVPPQDEPVDEAPLSASMPKHEFHVLPDWGSKDTEYDYVFDRKDELKRKVVTLQTAALFNHMQWGMEREAQATLTERIDALTAENAKLKLRQHKLTESFKTQKKHAALQAAGATADLKRHFRGLLETQKGEFEAALKKQKEELTDASEMALKTQKEELTGQFEMALKKQKEELTGQSEMALKKQKEELTEEFDSKLKQEREAREELRQEMRALVLSMRQ